MTTWPDEMTTAPLRAWPGILTPDEKRKTPPFAATKRDRDLQSGRVSLTRREVPLSETLALLRRELNALDADDVELLVAIAPAQFRRDGKPRADARPEHPGVVLSFTTGLGRLSYPCDTFTTWQGNLRAIALALEALRKVDRYGVTTHGEQYRGFLAIEGSASTTAADEEAWLRLYALARPDEPLAAVLARAKRFAHPDLGGDADDFDRIMRAERQLRAAGRL